MESEFLERGLNGRGPSILTTWSSMEMSVIIKEKTFAILLYADLVLKEEVQPIQLAQSQTKRWAQMAQAVTPNRLSQRLFLKLLAQFILTKWLLRIQNR